MMTGRARAASPSEEANTRLGDWMRQRARWLKGFLVTWLVHMREPATVHARAGAGRLLGSRRSLTLGVFASVLLHPLCMAATVVACVLYPVLPPMHGLALLLLSGSIFVVLVAGYAVSIILDARARCGGGVRRLARARSPAMPPTGC